MSCLLLSKHQLVNTVVAEYELRSNIHYSCANKLSFGCWPNLNLISKIERLLVFFTCHTEITNCASSPNKKFLTEPTLNCVWKHGHNIFCVFKNVDYSVLLINKRTRELVWVVLLKNTRLTLVVKWKSLHCVANEYVIAEKYNAQTSFLGVDSCYYRQWPVLLVYNLNYSVSLFCLVRSQLYLSRVELVTQRYRQRELSCLLLNILQELFFFSF